MPCANLEISLDHRGDNNYEVELRLTEPGGQIVTYIIKDGPAIININIDELNQYKYNTDEYGQILKNKLFSDHRIREALAHVLSQKPLRVRLFIKPPAKNLHKLHWEKLLDPFDSVRLCTNEQIYFSRYLSIPSDGAVCLRTMDDLRALVVVANPTNISQYQLPSINVREVILGIEENLGGIIVDKLASEGSPTINNIISKLREKEYNILFMVCHGILHKDETGNLTPWLWLEGEDGASCRISGDDLVTRMKELPRRPGLVVLASCQSAKDLSALGPLLVEKAGIPAVLAMQDNFSIETMHHFMPTFFRELKRDGLIDRAMAVARGEVRGRPDWWMPVLFMCLNDGKLWDFPTIRGIKSWPRLIDSIKQKECIPILGSDLTQHLFGCCREIARKWAKERNFPLAPHYVDDLPQVAQFVAFQLEEPLDKYNKYTVDKLKNYMREEIKQRYGDKLVTQVQGADLLTLLSEVGKLCRQKEYDPYKMLAGMRLPIYITTNYNDLLYEALKAEAGLEPKIKICPWKDFGNDFDKDLPPESRPDPNFSPDEFHPLVYHLFGHIRCPKSLVLTQDDYFDFLIGVAKIKGDKLYNKVKSSFIQNPLMFLGFQLDDWSFRILYRVIMKLAGREASPKKQSVAVQLGPRKEGDGGALCPEEARKYLEGYFGSRGQIEIFWGDLETFMVTLGKNIKEGNP